MSNLIWIRAPAPVVPSTIWEWPMAVYDGPLNRHAAYIICQTNYNEFAEKSGNHLPLGVVIMRYNTRKLIDPRRNLCDQRFPTLRVAIEFTQHFLAKNPDWQPKIL